MEGLSSILVVGAAGKLGRHLVEVGLSAVHPTTSLMRPTSFSRLHKSHLLHTLLLGYLQGLPGLVAAVKQVDVLISAVPSKEVPAQQLLVQAIKEAGGVKN